MWDLTDTYVFQEDYLLFPGASDKVTSACNTLLAEKKHCDFPIINLCSQLPAGAWQVTESLLTNS